MADRAHVRETTCWLARVGLLDSAGGKVMHVGASIADLVCGAVLYRWQAYVDQFTKSGSHGYLVIL